MKTENESRQFDPYGVTIANEYCYVKHPSIPNLRCRREPEHDGWHHAENVWWKE